MNADGPAWSRLSPTMALLCVALLALSAGLLATLGAIRAPWLDIQLQAAADGSVLARVNNESATLTAIAAAKDTGRFEARASDLIEEPDVLATYAEIDAVLARQAQLAAILAAPAVRLTLRAADGRVHQLELAPSRRPLGDLPATFWVQLVTGVGGLLIGGWVWALRQRDWAARLFALSGAGLMISALPAAIYGTRQLAIDPDLFRALMTLNHVGSLIFGGAVIGLFLCYPVMLVRPRWLLVLPALTVAVLAADIFRVAVEPPFYYLSILAEMTAIIVLIGVQWLKTRRDPAARAALAWLGVSVVVGAGSWTVIAAAPILLGGSANIPQGYSFGLFLLIYLGLALGVSRYRLFELGDWAFRILFFTLGTLLLLAIDAALVLALHIDKAPALGLALLLVGFLYLPLREALWRRFTRGRRLAEDELFGAVMDVAFAPTPGSRAERWRALMRRLFDPLEIDAVTQAADAPTLAANGLQLLLPATAGSPGLRLGYPWAGRGLFGPAHLALARHLVDLVGQAEASRTAYERGVTEERRRMAQDLHDDVGARLLSGLHTADDRTRPILHAAMADIRAIVTGLTGDHVPLDRVLADVRHECARRLEAAACTLNWPLPPEEAPVLLDYRLHKALTSSVRELVTNVIRHASAKQLAVAVERDDARLVLTLSDDGIGLPQAARDGMAAGQGLRGVARRMQGVGGDFSVDPSTQGTAIRLEFPLRAP